MDGLACGQGRSPPPLAALKKKKSKMILKDFMKTILLSLLVVGLFSPLAARSALSTSSNPDTDVYFVEKSGKVEEHALRQGSTAAHLYLDSSQQPYAFLAFPEGNSGVAIWFKTSDNNPLLTATSKPEIVHRARGLHGAQVNLKTGVHNLSIDDFILGSMRFIRDRELKIPAPDIMTQRRAIQLQGRKLTITQKSLNGDVDYVIELEAQGDTTLTEHEKVFRFDSPTQVQFQFLGALTEKPLTPLPLNQVFKKEFLDHANRHQLEAFSFLLYKEKLMAGSPRYLTKFGRDSNITLRVLMGEMRPEAIESLLNATLSGTHPTQGLVSHEQHEGDFASYERQRHGEKYLGIHAPIEDYKMIDDDFMLTVVLGEYAQHYPERVKKFVAGKDARGLSLRTLVQNNFHYVMSVTAAFTTQPSYKNLLRLRPGQPVGQWRDSNNGLGGGVYPFDVNAALVPGALKALSDIYSAKGVFHDSAMADKAQAAFAVWNTKVLPLFNVTIPAARLASYGETYLKSLGIDPRALPAPPTEDLVFPALSLDTEGKTIPIMHSDDSMMMTYGYPTAEYLHNVSQRIKYEFPYGLRTPVGILVANPVFASPELQKKFDENKYHGRVSWTMQENLLIFGFNRELQRTDLLPDLKKEMTASKQLVLDVLKAKASMGGTEVFSIVYKNGHYTALPFAGDAKSNSNQLWSHLSLAMPEISDH